MLVFLTNLESWHWLSLGIALLTLEVLGTAGFLLGLGLGAICVALLMSFMPTLSWQAQFSLFGILSLVCTLVYWKKFRALNQETDQPLLNDRTAHLVGRQVDLMEAVVNGRGTVQIEDTLWTVAAETDLAKGVSVTITGADGMVLNCEASKHQG